MEEQKKRNKYGKYLPIGTVVLLKTGKKRMMITGFMPIQKKDGKETVYDYCGVVYPEGVISMQQVLMFNHNQIQKIFHMGLYNDKEERAFKEKLKETLKQKSIGG